MQSLRQTAFKLWVYDIINSPYIKQEGEWEPNYLEFNGNKVSRVNIIANVILKFESDDKNYCNLVLDDGSGTIRVKTWGEDTALISNINIGDMILMIGRPRSYNEEIYINPEIVKKIDNPNLELLRKLELLKRFGKSKPREKIYETEVIEKEISNEEEIIDVSSVSERQKILNLIEKHNSENGASVNEVINNIDINKEKAEQLIQDLLKDGEIYQPKNGRLKIIE